jgi:hypothetical protein
MIFTCTLVRNHPDTEGVRCETRSAAINSKILGWAWQQDACSEGEARKVISSAWNEAMKDVFARCSKKIAVQVCTVIIV